MHKSARDLCYENGTYLADINVRIGLRLYLKGQSEHCASMSKLVASPVMAIDSHSLKSESGPNDIFRFQSVSGIFFPFMFGITDLYVEVDPQNLTEDERLKFLQLDLAHTSAKKFTRAFSVFLRLVK